MVEKKEHIAHSGTPIPVYGISWETAAGERGERRCRFVVEPADTGQTV
ncbi:MAG: hypothetical protein LUG47_00125 [Clostridiales bacterium]|nr:hypothetical protein [Clostridiales bacterium]